jgi:uncharacterized repeat protein (TIGR01451 family)
MPARDLWLNRQFLGDTGSMLSDFFRRLRAVGHAPKGESTLTDSASRAARIKRAPAALAALTTLGLIAGMAATGPVAAAQAAPAAAPKTAAAPAAAPAGLGNGVLSLSKVAGNPTPVAGSTFIYSLTFGCSSTTTGCVNATVTDPVPAPLQVVGQPIVSGAGTVDAQVNGNTVSVLFQDPVPNTTPPSTGLAGGAGGTIQIQVKVPDDLPKSDDGLVLTNTGTFTAANATTVTASAPVTLSVPTVLAENVTKTWSPDSTAFNPNEESQVALTAQNTSNVPVSSISIIEPDNPTDPSSVFNFYNAESLQNVVFPQGADQVQLVGTTASGPFTGAVGVVPTLPAGVDAAALTSIQIIFSSSSGATIIPGGTAGSIGLTLQQRATNRTTSDPLFAGGTYINRAGGTVVAPDGTADAPEATAQQVVSPLNVKVTTTKTFTPSQLPAGNSSVGSITAQNTSTGSLDSLTIQDPSPGQAGFFTQDVTFGGFSNATSAWPDNAANATVSYTVNTGTAPSPVTVTKQDGLPATAPSLPSGQFITGWTVVYHGPVATGAQAKIDFTVNTSAAAGPAGSGFNPYENTTTATGANTAGTGTATADAELQVFKPAIDLTFGKTVSPSTVFPGGTQLVQLPASTPSGTSSVRPTEIVVSEPQNPIVAGDYWDAFDVSAIAPTAVPTGSKLTVTYTTDGVNYQTLTVVDATGGAKSLSGNLSTFLPGGVSPSQVQGLRFDFTDPTGFGQATTVKPGLVFTARATLRIEGTSTAPGNYPQTTPYTNCASSSATGTVAGTGQTVTDGPIPACADVAIKSITGGPGPLAAAKSFDDAVLPAQSQANTGANLVWGVQTVGYQNVAVSDPADPTVPVSQSIFQAFNLTGVDAITPSTDPLIRWDAVTKVELYNGTSNQWVDVTSQACSTAAVCQGTFPGLTLTTAQQQSTTGVRLTFAENPNRQTEINQNPTLNPPPVGSGVASATSGSFPGPNPAGRQIHLKFQLRDQLRDQSAGSPWATGETVYNMGADSPGAIDNTMNVHAVPQSGAPSDLGADAHTTIEDPSLTVNVTKTVSPTTLVVPQPDVDPSAFPTATYTTAAQNTSPTNTWQLRLSDPGPCTSAGDQTECLFPTTYSPLTNPFESLNLTGATVAYSANSGINTAATLITLQSRADDGTLTSSTIPVAQLALMSADALAHVVGISVLAVGNNNASGGAPGSNTGGTIAPNATVTLTLQTQLRKTARSSGALTLPGTVNNNAEARLHDEVLSKADAEGEQTAPLTLVNGNLQVVTSKSFDPTSTLQTNPASSITVGLRGRSTGSLNPKQLIITDTSTTFWNAFDLSTLTVPNAPTGANQVQVDAQTGLGASATWTLGVAGPLASAALPGVAPGDVTGLRFTFSRTDGASFPATNNVQNVTLSVTLRTQLRDGSGPVTANDVPTPMPGETQPGVVTDTVLADASYDTIHATQASANATFTLNAGTVGIAVQKTTPGQTTAGKIVPFTLKFKNTGTGYFTNPVLTDTLPADGSLLFVPTDVPNYSTTAGGLLTTDPSQIVRSYDAATGVISFSFPAGSHLAPNETYSITLNLQVAPGLPPGTTTTNTVGVTGDRAIPPANCTKLVSNQPGVTFDAATNTCSTNNVVTVLSQGSITASKGVQSASDTATNIVNPAITCTPDADGYYQYPCAANSTVGGTDHWKLSIVNGGNIPVTSLTAVDVLPYPGDVGVVDPSPRGSTFSPVFNGDVDFLVDKAAGADLDWYVTTQAKPCVTEIDVPTSTCAAGDWLPSSDLGVSVDPAAVTAFKMVFDFSKLPSGQLPPAASLTVTYSTTNVPTTQTGDKRAPVTAPVDPSTQAWNSFGLLAHYASGTQPSGPQEPIKAGVVLSGGPLEIHKSTTGAGSNFAPTSFDANVACTVAGADVDLGANSLVTLDAANNYTVRIDGIPIGSACTVTEAGAQGSYGETTRTVSPEKIIIAPAAASDPVPTAQITNDYANTSLTVTKHVDTAATVGSFGPFSYSLACTTSLGTSVPLNPTDATFQLSDGGSHEIDNLPVGANCVVTETDDSHADSVSISANGAPATTGPEATVTLGVDPNTAAVVNHYDSGQLAVTKTLAGDGADQYGSDKTFTVAVQCTYQGQTLYSDTLSLIGGETTTLDPIFPAGTQCSTQETTTGGANDSNVDKPTVVIEPSGKGSADADGVTTVNVTNTFNEGSVQVTKVRTGPGADTYGAGPFTAQVTCSYQADGKTIAIQLPDGGIVTLNADNDYTATVSGLIEGASCVTSELDNGGVTSVAYDPQDGTVTVPNGKPATVTITNTFDTGSLVINKDRVGDGAAKFGAGPFTVQVGCSYDKDGVVTPIALGDDASVQLDASNEYSHTINDLIAGANCTVEETNMGLATSKSLDPADGMVTIGDGSSVTVTITNTFTVGHLSLAKTVDKSTVQLGGNLVYTITLTNDGEIDAKDVTVDDKLPSGISVSSTTPAATAVNGGLEWSVPDLAVGASTVFTVNAKVTAVGSITNLATANTPPGPWDPTSAPPSSGTCPAADLGDACATTVVTAPPSASGIADTGSNVLFPLTSGLLALLAGAALLLGTRKFSKKRHRSPTVD